jgi:hypothetical protein
VEAAESSARYLGTGILLMTNNGTTPITAISYFVFGYVPLFFSATMFWKTSFPTIRNPPLELLVIRLSRNILRVDVIVHRLGAEEHRIILATKELQHGIMDGRQRERLARGEFLE